MSVYIPRIKNYAPFYIQSEEGGSAVDIQQAYGVTIKVHEYPIKRKVKQPYAVERHDTDGADEWTDELWLEAFSLRLSCVILSQNANSGSAREEIKNAVRQFLAALRSGALLIYDDWTKFGFQHVRLQEIPEIREGDFTEKDGRCRLIFDVVLKVNDPTTEVTLSNGELVVVDDEEEEE